MLFCDAEVELILTIFEAIYGFHVNRRKSQIITVNEVPQIQSLAGSLGCEVGQLPTIYLGLPLGAKNKTQDIWNGVLERCENKLSNWKSNYLSLGGRIALVNTEYCAGFPPTYMMSLFPLPVKIERRLDALRRKFICRGNKEINNVTPCKMKDCDS